MGNQRIVVYDLRTGITQELTSEGDGWAHFPVWGPDGERIVYGARGVYGDLRDDIFSIAADFSGASQPFLEYDSDGAVPLAYAPSGELVFSLNSGGRNDIWMLSAGGGEPRLVLGGEADEQGAAVSPDGRWIAYSSDRSGQDEIYVEPFPSGGPRVQVSSGGGSEPRWSPRGSELFYRNVPKMIAVPITLEPRFAITGEAEVLFERDEFDNSPWHVYYDIDHDGQRFLMVEQVPRDEQQPASDRRIHLMVNVFTELERLVPTG
jgi:serine/threonine-protein kinase